VRETRVKPVGSALAARETFVKPWRCPPSNNPACKDTAPQPRGIARKPCPCLVRGYEAG